MKTVAIIQARLGSNRLPRKVLHTISGQTMIEHVVERVRRCRHVDEVVVATTTQAQDRELIEFCKQRHWAWFSGSENDVLQRFVDTADHFLADQIVRITSDCPLIDAELIDRVIETLNQNSGCDYACNFHPNRWFPRGLDCEALTRAALQRLHERATEPNFREHVTLFAYRNMDLFSIDSICCEQDWSHLRWTVDTDLDLELVRKIYRHFGTTRFTWTDVIAAYREHPEWIEINRNSVQKVA